VECCSKFQQKKSPIKLLKIKLFISPPRLKQEIDEAEVGCPRPKARGLLHLGIVKGYSTI